MDSVGRLILRNVNSGTARENWAKSIASIESKLISDDLVKEKDEVWASITHAARNIHFQDIYFNASIDTSLNLGGLKFQLPSNSSWTKLASRASDSKQHFTFIDLFAGIGGFHLALEAQGGHCVFASEWDKAARLTYAMNYGLVPFGDIRKFTRDREGTPLSKRQIRKLIPYADVISAGFPCQPFSLAGVSSRNFHGLEHGFRCEAQGTLFEDILLVAQALKPKAMILENVRNLASHDRGNTIRVIRNEIKKAGYTILPEWNSRKDWAVIDSRAVVGQARKRVYMVCIRRDLARSLADKIGEFSFPEFKVSEGKFTLRQAIDSDDTMSDNEKFSNYAISNRLLTSHLDRDRRHALKNNGFQTRIMYDLNSPAPTLVARYYKDGKDCLIPHPKNTTPPRMLTPRECAYLQTFPKRFWIPNSKSAAYKQFGNSITVEIARRIAAELIRYINTN
jgi:DNA (cytosine-5)-methyltransferase 1